MNYESGLCTRIYENKWRGTPKNKNFRKNRRKLFFQKKFLGKKNFFSYEKNRRKIKKKRWENFVEEKNNSSSPRRCIFGIRRELDEVKKEVVETHTKGPELSEESVGAPLVQRFSFLIRAKNL